MSKKKSSKDLSYKGFGLHHPEKNDVGKGKERKNVQCFWGKA
jgi:hypothetical protein